MVLISVFEAELQDVIPICHATIAGTRIVGRLTAGYVHSPTTQAAVQKLENSWGIHLSRPFKIYNSTNVAPKATVKASSFPLPRPTKNYNISATPSLTRSKYNG
jgi:hypothetical protein